MNNSSTYINSFFEAIKTVSSHTAANSNSPLTIEARIENVVDAGAGIYSVSYMTNIFEVRTNPSLKYEIGENVYVLIPAGDFSNDKFIIGTTKNSNAVFVNNDETLFYDISDNLITNTLLATSEHGLSSYKDTISTPEDISKDGKSFGQLMRGYVDDYNYFRLDVKIRTALAKEQQIYGNYGIVLAIPVVIDNIEDSYEYFSIDITNMKGSPYQFLDWASQSLIFSLNNTYDISRQPQISLFCTDFPQDEEKALTITDLFFSGISLKCINKMAEQDLNGYFLNLKASEGEYFVGTYRSEKTIEPFLRLNGKQTKIPQNAPIYWFKEDMSIKNDSDYYSRYGGMGWKCLNEKIDVQVDSDGSKTFNYSTSPRTLTVKKDDVSFATRYKCVIIYDENIISNTITLKNLESNKYITLSCDSATNTYLTNGTGNVFLTVNVFVKSITDSSDYINQMSYSFLRYDLNNQPITTDGDDFFKCEQKNVMKTLDIDNDGEKESVYQSIFSFPVASIDTLNKIYCISKYNKEDKVIDVGTASISVMTSDRLRYNVVINNANQVYKYDADGDSPMIEAYDGPASSKITSIAPLSFEVYDEEGNEFKESQYADCHYSWIVPKKCMVIIENQEPTREDETNYYYEGIGHLSQLNYTIARRYNKAAAMNGIKLIISFKEETIQANVPLFFLKDGESGTNGTSYAAILTSGINYTQSYPYGVRNDSEITQKLTLVYSVFDKKWYYRDTNGLLKLATNLPKIFTKVYYNGEILDSNNYTVEYEVFDEKITNPCIEIGSVDSSNGLSIKPIENIELDSSINTCNIIQAKIVTENISAMNSDTQILYAYYPVEIVIANSYVSIETMLNASFPSIDGGFYDVVYASDGTNPSYDETELFYLDGVNTEYYTVSWVTQHHLSQTEVKDENGKINTKAVKITPDNKYTDGNTMNYVRADMVVNGDSTIPEREKELADLQNEKIKISNKINLLDKRIDNLNKFINGDDNIKGWLKSIEEVSDIKNYITERAKVTSNISSILDYINNNYSLAIDDGLKEDLRDLRNEVNKILVLNEFYELDELLEKEDDYTSTEIILVQDINTIIKIYNKVIIDYNAYISTEEGKEQYENFEDLIGNLILLNYNCFKEDDVEFYKSLNAALTTSKYYANITYNDFIVYFNNIYNTILKSVYTKDFDIIPAERTRIDTDKKELIKEQEEIQKSIDEITRIIGLDHIEITYIRPIVITTNRYEMANFNAWDGNKIYVDDAKSYIMAPQIGAGTKEKDNSFTGIVMGGKTTNKQTKYGMFGYYHGEQTLMLSAENGSAIFGKAKSESGQIVIDPASDSALLYSSKFFNSTAIDNNTGLPTQSAYNEVKNIIQSREDKIQTHVSNSGMLIDLSTPGIVFGSGNFKVTPEGYLVAKAGGSIGGWRIGINDLYSQDFLEGKSGVKLSSTGYIAFGSDSGFMYSGKHGSLTATRDGFYISGDGLSIGSKFKVTKEGTVEVGKGATTSTGKHWTIAATGEDTYIKYGDRGSTSGEGSVYISTSEICLGNKFRVTSNGTLYLGDGSVKGNSSKHWTISAKKRVGAADNEPLEAYIGYNRSHFKPTEDEEIIHKDSVYIGTDGIALGKTFSVDAEGNLIASNATIKGTIEADEGNIAGWIIGHKYIEDKTTGQVIKDPVPILYNTWKEKGKDKPGVLELRPDSLYGHNDYEGDDPRYVAWQLNSSGTAAFSHIALWKGVNAGPAVLDLLAGYVRGGILGDSSHPYGGVEFQYGNITLEGVTFNGAHFKPTTISVPTGKGTTMTYTVLAL